ncbi:hypothetical protein ACH4UR_02190 [Streptomyces lydicus]|uniref:hypothetical protein n=1 Tax=Streptomyces lydicus TaxID=47763 RepID=UPI0033D5E952
MDDERTAVEGRTTVEGRAGDAGEGLPEGFLVRHPVPADHRRLQVALAGWWGGLGGDAGALQRQLLVPRLFLQHFAGTSFLVERPDHTLHAFLIGSIAYHTRMGFRLEPGDRTDEHGVPVHRDYDGPGLDRVSFVRDLPGGPGAIPPVAAP